MERYFTYSKEGHSFIIKSILNEPVIKTDKRKDSNKLGNNRKDFKEFVIPMELENKKGVYKITQGNNIYIGSTFREKGFRERFRGHLYKTNEMITRDMLLKGGKFEAIWICDDNLKDEYIVRNVEEYIIRYYKENTSLNVVNRKDKAHLARGSKNNTNTNTKPKNKKKLNESNIEFKERKKKGV